MDSFLSRTLCINSNGVRREKSCLYHQLPFVCNKDEEGRSGPFVDRIREQEKLEKTMYVKEIENALTGNR